MRSPQSNRFRAWRTGRRWFQPPRGCERRTLASPATKLVVSLRGAVARLLPATMECRSGPILAREFDRLVARALRRISPRYRRRLENVVMIVEREPPRPGLLGLYEGRPLTERSVSEGFRLPDRITIYQGPHERMARTREELERLVEETVWHEIAHYFGMNEIQVRRAEVRRARRTL